MVVHTGRLIGTLMVLALVGCASGAPPAPATEPAGGPGATSTPGAQAPDGTTRVTVEELLTLPGEGELPADAEAAVEFEAELVRQTVLASLREPGARRLLGDGGDARAEEIADAFAEAMREMARARQSDPDELGRAMRTRAVACVPSLDGPPCPDDPADAEGYDDYATDDKDVDVATPDGCVTQTAKVERQDWLKDGRKGIRHYTLLEVRCEDEYHLRDETSRWGEAQACPGPEGQVPGEIRVDRARDINMAVEGGTLTGRTDATASGLMQVRTNDEAEHGGWDAASINWRYEPRARIGDGPEDGASFEGHFSLSDMSFEPGTAEQLEAEAEAGGREGATGFMAEFLEWMTTIVFEASNHWKTSGNCVVLTVTEGHDPPELRGGESHAFRLEASHREGGQLDVQVEVIGTALEVATVTPGGKVASPADFTYTAAPASVRQGNYRDTVGFITKSKRGIGTTAVGVAVNAQQGSYDVFYEYEASDGLRYTGSGSLEPNEDGELVGEATVEGMYWVATRITGDVVENCVHEPFSQKVLLHGNVVGEGRELFVWSDPEPPPGSVWLFTVSIGGTVPIEGGEVTYENPSAEEGGYGFGCSSLFHRTETLRVIPRP